MPAAVTGTSAAFDPVASGWTDLGTVAEAGLVVYPTTDIVDRIDELVDDQLAAGPRGFATEHAPRRCPHCDRDWHGLAITQRLERMRIEHQQRVDAALWSGEGEVGYAESVIDPDYRYSEDDSPILCPGSDFIGPPQPRPRCECSECTEFRQSVSGMGANELLMRLFGLMNPLWALPAPPPLSLERWLIGDPPPAFVAPDPPTPESSTTEAEPANPPRWANRPLLPRPATRPPMWADTPQNRRRDRRVTNR